MKFRVQHSADSGIVAAPSYGEAARLFVTHKQSSLVDPRKMSGQETVTVRAFSNPDETPKTFLVSWSRQLTVTSVKEVP